MLLSKDKIEKILRVIRDRHNLFVVNALGEEQISDETLRLLKEEYGEDVVHQISDLITDGYYVGYLRNKDLGSVDNISHTQFTNMEKPYLNDLEKYSIEHSKETLEMYTNKLSANVQANFENLIRDYNKVYKDYLMTNVGLPMATIAEQEGKSISELVAAMRDLTGDFARDWERCFIAGTRIIVKGGIKNIEDIEVGDVAQTASGTYKKVTHLFKNKFSGRMYTIKTKNTEITATYNHEVYVLRGEKRVWISCDNLVVGDKVVKARGYHTYKDPYWLKKKYIEEKLSQREIAKLCGVNESRIDIYIKEFGIILRPRKRDNFKGRKHTKETRKKMSIIASSNNNSKRLQTKKAKKNRIKTIKEEHKSGRLKAWNKGLTKETDERILKMSKNLEDRVSWNKGLTKETSKSVRIGNIKGRETRDRWSDEYKNNIRKKQSNTLCRRIAAGEIETYSIGLRGKIRDGEEEHYYMSLYEKFFLEKSIREGRKIISKHRIVISYSLGDKKHNYIPDFLIDDKYLIEIKAQWAIEENYGNVLEKKKAAEKYCDDNNLIYRIVTEKELGLTDEIYDRIRRNYRD